MTADVGDGDTFTVNGEPVAAYMGTDSAIDAMAGSAWNGRWVSFVFDGETLNFKGGGGKVTVSGLTADNIRKNATVTIKQGAKVISNIAGTYDCLFFGNLQSGISGSNVADQFSFGTPSGSKYSNDNASLPLRVTLPRTPKIAYVYSIEGQYDTSKVTVGNKVASGFGLKVLTGITGNTVTIEKANASVRKVIAILG